jgi:hypothetical protein
LLWWWLLLFLFFWGGSNGNVALDIARVLLKDPHGDLGSTDIADHALQALKGSRVRQVVLMGRRGPLQVRLVVLYFR